MEALLHLIWSHRLYTQLYSPEHLIEVIDPGIPNADAGADFYNAKVMIDGLLWVGNVEIHTRARDWYSHCHHQDPAYDTTILHVSADAGAEIVNSSGGSIVACQMLYPEHLDAVAERLLRESTEMPCSPLGGVLATEQERLWLEQLLHERLDDRRQMLQQWYEQSHGDRSEALYILLMRYFGFSLNSDAMERLARSLPVRTLLKHRDRHDQLEALLLGQASMLDTLDEGEYAEHLQGEYTFLKHKYGLTPIARESFRKARTRPSNFPERRLRQVALLLHHNHLFADRFLQIRDEKSLQSLFDVSLHCLASKDSRRTTQIDSSLTLSAESMMSLGVNVVAPYQWFVGCLEGNAELKHSAVALLQSLPCEDNQIIRRMKRAGLAPSSALCSQSLLHLYKRYCQTRKCLYCQWGRAKLVASEGAGR